MGNLSSRIAIAIAIAGIPFVSACTSGKQTKPENRGVTVVDQNKILRDQSLSPAEKAEKLARSAELLLTPNGFMYAETVFQSALSVDPKNERALFYTQLLAGPMELKGILARIRPLAFSTKDSRRQYVTQIAKIKEGPLKNFLFDGKPDIRTEKDLQKFGDELFEVQDEFRKYLKNNKSLTISLYASEWLTMKLKKSNSGDCYVNEVYPGYFELLNCGPAKSVEDEVTEYKVNRSDVEAMEQVAAGVQIGSILSLAYDATGTVRAARKFEGESAKNSVIWRELSRVSEFGKLRTNGEALKRIIPMGVDAVAGVRYAAAIQRELCPKGKSEPNSRPGFLFETGLCVPEKMEDGLSSAVIL